MTNTETLRAHVKECIDHADERSLRLVQAILEVEEQEDWWDELPAEVQGMLEAAIKEGEEGKGISHGEMEEKYARWFKK